MPAARVLEGHTVRSPRLRVSFGGLTFSLTAGGLSLLHGADWSYAPFVEASPPEVDPQSIGVHLEVRETPSAEGTLLLAGTSCWSVLADGALRTLAFRFPAELEPVFVLNLDLAKRSILGQCSPRLVRTVDGEPALDCSLFSYPLDQILAMYFLGGNGLVLHAAGSLVRGQAVVLSGVSGAGKTTFSRLVTHRAGWEPMSDDRVIVSALGPPRAWGTPWPGEGNVAANISGNVSYLLFLEKGETNVVRPLPPALALRRLLQTASLPWFDATYLDLALAACDRIIAATPTGTLTFRPDLGAVEAVESLLA